jgi:tetratricopeptide (TPR) repeat protein
MVWRTALLLVALLFLTNVSKSWASAAQDCQRAHNLISDGRFAEAVRLLNRTIQSNQTYADAYTIRAEAYANLNDFAVARSDCFRALKIDPKAAQAHYWLSVIDWNIEKWEDSLDHINKFIDLRPRDARGYFRRGEVYVQLKQNDKAIADYTRSIDLDPQYYQCLVNRANLLNYKGGDLNTAIADYTQALQLKNKRKDYTRLYPLRAIAYERKGDYQKAIDDYTYVLNLNPDDEDAYAQRAQDYVQLKQYNKAIADYSRAIELVPYDAAPCYVGRAKAYRLLGRNELAQRDLDSARKLDYAGSSE